MNISKSRYLSQDVDLFIRVINQGIDGRLEAFTKSKFTIKEGRLFLLFHRDEMAVLLRRLDEIADKAEDEDDSERADQANRWATDIIQVHYGIEII